MIDGLKPYPAMKDSGVAWLREVPEHWEVRRLCNAAEMRASNIDKHTKDDEQPIRLCNGAGDGRLLDDILLDTGVEE